MIHFLIGTENNHMENFHGEINSGKTQTTKKSIAWCL